MPPAWQPPPPYDQVTRRMIQGPGVPTLKEFASRVISSNISTLTDIGDMPFELVGRFLADMPAAQLAKVELNSPAIRPESKGLWKALVLRDYFEVRIPYEKGDMLEPKNWRKVYLMATDAREAKEAAGRERLRAGYAELETRKAERALVRDLSLREPVKKGRFGPEPNLRRPAASVFSKARTQTKSSLNAFKQPVSASAVAASRGKKPLSTPSAPIYRPSPATAIALHTQPTKDPGQRFTIGQAGASTTARGRASGSRELIVPKGVYVAPPLAPVSKPKEAAIRVDFFTRPSPAHLPLKGKLIAPPSSRRPAPAYPDDLPLPLPGRETESQPPPISVATGSAPISKLTTRSIASAASPPAGSPPPPLTTGSTTAASSRPSTPGALSPRTSLSVTAFKESSRAFSPEISIAASSNRPLSPAASQRSSLPPPPAQSRSGGTSAFRPSKRPGPTDGGGLWIPTANKRKKPAS